MKTFFGIAMVFWGALLLQNSPVWARDPMVLYQDNYFRWFHASGWIGNAGDLAMNAASTEQPYSGTTCVKIEYQPKVPKASGWAGIYWQYPVNNWGTEKGRTNLKGAKRLVFYARGARGGETVTVKIGGLRGKKYSDSDMAQATITLTEKWKPYAVNLRGKDLSHIIGGFLVVFKNMKNPNGATVYLDDIQYRW